MAIFIAMLATVKCRPQSGLSITVQCENGKCKTCFDTICHTVQCDNPECNFNFAVDRDCKSNEMKFYLSIIFRN